MIHLFCVKNPTFCTTFTQYGTTRPLYLRSIRNDSPALPKINTERRARSTWDQYPWPSICRLIPHCTSSHAALQIATKRHRDVQHYNYKKRPYLYCTKLSAFFTDIIAQYEFSRLQCIVLCPCRIHINYLNELISGNNCHEPALITK
jgi:hypothetical protein